VWWLPGSLAEMREGDSVPSLSGRNTFEALMESSESGKRTRSDSESSAESVSHKKSCVSKKAIVFITSNKVNLSKVNPMVLNRSIVDAVGPVEKVQLLSDSVKLVCTSTQVGLLKQEKKLCGYTIKLKVSEIPPPSIKGIIHGVHSDIEETDFHGVENLIKAERMTRFNKETNQRDRIGSVILQFSGNSIPSRIYLGFQSFTVQEFVPRPVRCYKCQRYGHVATNCRGSARCPKCGESHGYEECTTETPSCLHCGGNHSVAFKGCPKYKEAQQVQSYKFKNKVSFAEAVKAVVPKNTSVPQNITNEIPSSQVEKSAQSIIIQTSSSTPEFLPKPTQEATDEIYTQIVAFVAKTVAICHEEAFWKRPRNQRVKHVTNLANSIFKVDLNLEKVLDNYQSALNTNQV